MLGWTLLLHVFASQAAVAPPQGHATAGATERFWVHERRGPICDHGTIGAVALHPTRPLVAATGRRGRSWHGLLKVYDLQDGAVLDSWFQNDGRHSDLGAVAFSRDGSLVAAGNQAGTITLWELPPVDVSRERWSLRLRRKWRVPEPVADLEFHPADRHLLAGGPIGKVYIIEINGGSAPAEFRPGPRGGVTSLRFAPDGDTVATSHGPSGAVAVWSFRNGRTLQVLKRGRAFSADTAFLPDGRLLAAYGCGGRRPTRPAVEMDHPDEHIRVWDYVTGKLVKTWRVGGHGVNSISLSPDRRLLAAGHENRESASQGAIAILNAETGERISLIKPWWGASDARMHATGNIVIAYGQNRIGAWRPADDPSARPLWNDRWTWWDDATHYDP